jgi:hypothetical protein
MIDCCKVSCGSLGIMISFFLEGFIFYFRMSKMISSLNVKKSNGEGKKNERCILLFGIKGFVVVFILLISFASQLGK